MNVADQDRYQKHIVVGYKVGSSGGPGRQFAELVHAALSIPRTVAADGVAELGPQSLVAGRKTRENLSGEVLGRYKRPHTVGHVQYVVGHTNEHSRDQDGVGLLLMQHAEHVTQVVVAICAVAVRRDNGLVFDA